MEILQLKPPQVTRAILDLLCQLGNTRSLTISDAQLIIENQINRNHLTYVLYKDGIPLGIGSIIISERLIRNGGIVGQIEDVAIHKDHHNLGYGRMMIKHLVKTAKKNGAYKVILDCSAENVNFYQRCGLMCYHTQMRLDLK
jgi:glucosamine-phosphate N-acetyltransferase